MSSSAILLKLGKCGYPRFNMGCFDEDFDLDAALEQHLEEDFQEGEADASTAAEAATPRAQVFEVEGGGAEARGVNTNELEVPDAEELPTRGRAFTLRAKRIGLTFAQCNISPEEAAKQLMEVKGTVGLRIARETHADGTPHLHCLLLKGQERKDGDAYDLKEEGKSFHPNIRVLKTAKHACHWHFYLEKESKPIQAGTYKVPAMPGRTKKGEDILKDAHAEGVQSALKKYIEAGGAMEKVPMVQRGLEIMLAPEKKKPRWQHVADEQNIQLRAWQKDLIERLKQPPKQRRLFWICGPPGCGKTTFSNHLVKEFGKDDVFFCGKSVSYDGLVYQYQQQSVVIFDFPKSFDWIQMGRAAASCIEKFTEFGCMMNTPKYKGRSMVQLLGHCVVFSNIECIPELMHRDVQEINLLHMSEARRNRL